jgi:hypothetical protein
MAALHPEHASATPTPRPPHPRQHGGWKIDVLSSAKGSSTVTSGMPTRHLQSRQGCLQDMEPAGIRLGGHALARVDDEGGFGVPNNTITRRAATHTTNTRFVVFLGTFACPAQQVWLPGNNLQDPATWMPPPLCQLKQMQEDLLEHYDCTEQPVAAQPLMTSGDCSSAAANAGAISPQSPKTTATANSSFHSSTNSTRHSN